MRNLKFAIDVANNQIARRKETLNVSKCDNIRVIIIEETFITTCIKLDTPIPSKICVKFNFLNIFVIVIFLVCHFCDLISRCIIEVIFQTFIFIQRISFSIINQKSLVSLVVFCIQDMCFCSLFLLCNFPRKIVKNINVINILKGVTTEKKSETDFAKCLERCLVMLSNICSFQQGNRKIKKVLKN